jgi:hypothetical protein
MLQALPRPSGRGRKSTPKSDRALAHQGQGLKPQDCLSTPIHELKLVAITPKTLPIAYYCERIVAGNRHDESSLRADTLPAKIIAGLEAPPTRCLLLLFAPTGSRLPPPKKKPPVRGALNETRLLRILLGLLADPGHYHFPFGNVQGTLVRLTHLVGNAHAFDHVGKSVFS